MENAAYVSAFSSSSRGVEEEEDHAFLLSNFHTLSLQEPIAAAVNGWDAINNYNGHSSYRYHPARGSAAVNGWISNTNRDDNNNAWWDGCSSSSALQLQWPGGGVQEHEEAVGWEYASAEAAPSLGTGTTQSSVGPADLWGWPLGPVGGNSFGFHVANHTDQGAYGLPRSNNVVAGDNQLSGLYIPNNNNIDMIGCQHHHDVLSNSFSTAFQTPPNYNGGSEEGSNPLFSVLDKFTVLERYALVERLVNTCPGGSLRDQVHDASIRFATTDMLCSKRWQNILTSRKNPTQIENTLCAVLDFLFEIMKAKYGYHLFHHLLRVCRDHQIRRIVEKVTAEREELVELAKHDHGRKSVQVLLHAIKDSDRLLKKVISSLSAAISRLLIDSNGFHLIEYCMNHLSPKHNAFIYKGVLHNVDKVATRKYGCLSLSYCMSNLPQPHKQHLVYKIIASSAGLAQDRYGNFVVQSVITLSIDAYTDKLCSALEDHYIHLSMHKSGSHVVEKCIKSSGQSHVLGVLTACERLDQVARDKYGNYVLQTALNTTKGKPWHAVLVRALSKHSQSFRFHLYGRNVYELIMSVPNVKPQSSSKHRVV